MTAKVNYYNIIYFNDIRTGKIINTYSFYDKVDETNSSEHLSYRHKVLIKKHFDTIKITTRKKLNINDIIKIRYKAEMGSKIFEANGKRISSRFDIWDLISPVFFVLCSYILIGIVKSYFVKQWKT